MNLVFDRRAFAEVESQNEENSAHESPSLLIKGQGGDSQNFLQKFVRFFVTLGLKILRLFRLRVLFEADIIK